MANCPAYKNMVKVKAVAESQNKFARDLYMALAKKSKGNLFFSPFSLATALSMVNIGSKGDTDAQMQMVMHLPADKNCIKKAYFDMISDFKKEVGDYELKTSNMAYISHKLTVIEDFAACLSNDFLSSSKLVDFGQSEEVRQEINGLVEKETNSKIKNLIPSGILDDLTRMVLVNAIYFKGLWVHTFDPKETKPLPFWITADKFVETPMMTVEKKFGVAPKADLDATLLVMDYEGGRLSFVIVLPEKRDGLGALEEKIASLDLATLVENVSTLKTRVFLPKFKLQETLELAPVLAQMGMNDLFNEDSCDLSGISGCKDLYVSNVIHKAFIEVNEEGTEAAAATGVVMMTKLAMVRPNPPFKADHPFFFFVRDKGSNTVLFAGRYVSP